MSDNDCHVAPRLHCWICGKWTDVLLRFVGADGSVTYAHEQCWKKEDFK